MKALLHPIQTKLQRNGIAVNLNWKKQKLLDIFPTAYGLEPTGTNLDSNTPSKTAAQELNEMKKISLNYVYSKVTYESRMREFKEASIIRDNIPVNINGVARESCEWFSQSEYIPDLKLTHFASIDPYHILTCMRSLVCRKGIPERGIRTDAWIDVARDGKTNGSNLNMSHVDSNMMIDKQKVVVAERYSHQKSKSSWNLEVLLKKQGSVGYCGVGGKLKTLGV